MRILLDECVPIVLAQDLVPHEVISTRRRGWTSLKDSQILRRATQDFDVVLTVDQSLEYQHAIPQSLILVTIVSRSIRYNVLREFVPEILKRLESARPGDVIRISQR